MSKTGRPKKNAVDKAQRLICYVRLDTLEFLTRKGGVETTAGKYASRILDRLAERNGS